MSLLGIDIGTTGCKAIIFSKTGEILVSEYMEYPLIHPAPGWIELDPDIVLSYVKKSIKRANQKIKNDRVKAFAISCQGEAVIPVDKEGNCLYNAIVTFDGRTGEQYEFWKKNLGSSEIFKITGMPLNPMYSINKIMWLRKYRKDIFKSVYKFLCFEDFIQLKLGISPSISYSLAARTAAFDVLKKQWSDSILYEAKIDSSYLANPVEAAEIIGEIPDSVSEELGFIGNPICAGGGHDQACGAFGSGILKESLAMNAMGTSDAVIVVLDKPFLNEVMLINNYPCAPYVIPDKYTILTFNLTGGLLLRWYRDTFCYEEKELAGRNKKSVYAIIDDNIYSSPSNLFILPHFVGSGTPTLDAESKGIIIGLDLETNKAKISRAVFESCAYDLQLNIGTLESMGIKIENIIAVGGGAKSAVWLQIKADITNKRILTLENSEAASLGAAMLAGVAIGEYRNHKDAVNTAVRYKNIIKPRKKFLLSYKKRYKIYEKIYKVNKELLHEISKLNYK